MRKIVVALLLMLAWPALAQVPPPAGLVVNNTPVSGGSSGQCLYKKSDGRLGAQACGSGTAADITVGTTTVTGGADGNVLGKAAGVLSVFTTSGTGTVLALTASPTFTGTVGAAAITATGSIAAGASSSLLFTGRSQIQSTADGVLLLMNNAGSDFTSLHFGGTTNSFPSLQRSATVLSVRLAGGGGAASFEAGNVSIGSVNSNFVVVNTSGGYGFGSGSFGTKDGALSRVGAGIIGVGTGAAGSTAGTLRAAALAANGSDFTITAANVVSPTSPNRTITISYGGTTYYLAAKTTND